MKGIILAGGSGTRLYPATLALSKQLIPVFDKPMIYYPLSVMMMAGIRDLLFITTPDNLPLFKKLLGDGSQLGCTFSYATQQEPKGIAQAFIIGEKFIGQDRITLILGDNIFYGSGLVSLLKASLHAQGNSIFAYPVKNPEQYGVVELDEQNNPLSIQEKPTHPKSRLAVPGIYSYDNEVVSLAHSLKPSKRGELEISDINRIFLAKKRLHVTPLDDGIAWFDAGTFESLMQASSFVQTIEVRQNSKVGCIEEVAYKEKYISKKQLIQLTKSFGGNSYGIYLKQVADQSS